MAAARSARPVSGGSRTAPSGASCCVVKRLALEDTRTLGGNCARLSGSRCLYSGASQNVQRAWSVRRSWIRTGVGQRLVHHGPRAPRRRVPVHPPRAQHQHRRPPTSSVRADGDQGCGTTVRHLGVQEGRGGPAQARRRADRRGGRAAGDDHPEPAAVQSAGLVPESAKGLSGRQRRQAHAAGGAAAAGGRGMPGTVAHPLVVGSPRAHQTRVHRVCQCADERRRGARPLGGRRSGEGVAQRRRRTAATAAARPQHPRAGGLRAGANGAQPGRVGAPRARSPELVADRGQPGVARTAEAQTDQTSTVFQAQDAQGVHADRAGAVARGDGRLVLRQRRRL
eukprot:ctg_165.g70